MVDRSSKKPSSNGGRTPGAGSDCRGRGPSFGSIVGQDELREALQAVAVHDDLTGLLVRGEKGTGKSTTVRGLADLLPSQRAVSDCPYGCPPDRPAAQCERCREREDPPVEQRPVPFVTLPLGATRDRVVGTLSVADALDGDCEFEPGLLARANRGVLYVDEVNLLDDHLVDVLLDAAASGVNRVERDGVSVSHPAEFTLVGTMNPEEGDVRPQLRDRFDLGVTVTACEDLEDRVAIIERAVDADGDGTPSDGDRSDRSTDAAIRDRLVRARDRLPETALPESLTVEIAERCRDSGVEGHRGDIATARAARAIAALDDRPTVIESDVRRAAELALPHRRRSRPFEDTADPESAIEDHFDEPESENEDGDDSETDGDGSEPSTDGSRASEKGSESGDQSGGEDGPGATDEEPERGDGQSGREPEAGDGETPDGRDRETGQKEADSGDGPAGSPARASDRAESADGEDGLDDGKGHTGEKSDGDDGRPDPDANSETEGTPLVPGQQRAGVGESQAPEISPSHGAIDQQSGATSRVSGDRVRNTDGQTAGGPRIRTERVSSDGDVDPAASVRAAANRGGAEIESRDLRQSVRAGSDGALVVFAVDASASMRPAMRTAKGTVLELLREAYQHRDEVAFVAFAGEDAEVLLPPTDSVTRAARHLKDLPTGDRTPLPDGIRTASDVIERADPAVSVVVLVTDGKANAAESSPVRETRSTAQRLAATEAHVVVVDAGEDDRSNLAPLVARETDGERVPLSALSAERIDAAVEGARSGDNET